MIRFNLFLLEKLLEKRNSLDSNWVISGGNFLYQTIIHPDLLMKNPFLRFQIKFVLKIDESLRINFHSTRIFE